MEYNPFSTITFSTWTTSDHSCRHQITCLTEVGTEIVTGSQEGLLLIWIRKDRRLKPKAALLDPGCAEILSLAACKSNKQVVSSSASGRLVLWSLEQAACVKRYKFPTGFTQLEISADNSILRDVLFCSGRQKEIVLFDLNEFSILSRLTTTDPWASGWTLSFFVFPRASGKEIAIIGLCNDGVVRLWSIQEAFLQSDITECESKATPYTDANSISPCPSSQRIMCITSSRMFAIIDGYDFKELTRNEIPEQSHDFFVDCKFCGNERIASVKSNNVLTVFSIKVSALSLPGRKRAELSALTQVSVNPTDSLSGLPVMKCTPRTIIVGGNFENLKMFTLASEGTIDVEASCNKWTELVRDSFPALSNVSCCICLHSAFMVAVGYCDGEIRLVSVTTFLKSVLGIEGENEDSHSVSLRSHTCRIACMIHPHSYMRRYDRSFMLSSGHDFKICLWDIDHPTAPIFCFTALTSTVYCMFTPPNGHPFLNIVCCEATNGSLSLIYLADKKQVCLSRPNGAELSRLRRLYWRPQENLLAAQCSDASVLVWQLETGKLERIGRGLEAEDIVRACYQYRSTDISSLILPSPGSDTFNVCSVNVGVGTVHLISVEVNKLISSVSDAAVENSVHLVLKAMQTLPPALLLPSSVLPKGDTLGRSLTSCFYLPDSQAQMSSSSILRTIQLVAEWSLNNTIGGDFGVPNLQQPLCSKILVLLWANKFNLLSEASENLLKCAKTDETDIPTLSNAVQMLAKSFSADSLKEVVIRYEGSYLTDRSTSTVSYQFFALARLMSLLICGVDLPPSSLENAAFALSKILNEGKTGTRLYDQLSLRCAILFLLQVSYPFLCNFLELEPILLRIVVMLVSAANNIRYERYYTDLLSSARKTLYVIALFDPLAFIHVIARLANKASSNPSTSSHLALFNKGGQEILECLRLLYENASGSLRTSTVELIQLCLMCGEKGQSGSEDLLTKISSQDNVCSIMQPRRILVGTDHGWMVLFDSIPQAKYQRWHLFSKKVNSVSLSPDGKLMTGFCQEEGKVVIWQVITSSTSLFASGSSPRELKSFSVPVDFSASKFVWVSNRSLILLSDKGEEIKFSL